MATTVEEVYPQFLLDLDDELEPQIEAILDAHFSRKQALGMDDTPERNNTLKSGLRAAIDAYANGAWERAAQRSETEENEALDRVSQKAQGLYDALLNLMDYPGLEARLERQTRTFPHHYEFENGVNLPELIGERRNIFQGFREMIVDLQACAEAEINRKPKPVLSESIKPDQDPVRWDTDEGLQERMRNWRQRSKDRKFEKDHALQEFLRTFKPYWEQYTPLAFSEGMHFHELGETDSPLVSLIETILGHVDGGVTRANIVTSLRKVRKQSSSKTLS